MKKILLSILVVSAIVLFFSGNVYAKEQSQTQKISVSPAIIEVAGDKTERKTLNLNISNGGDNPLPISLEAQSFFTEDQFLENSDTSRYDASKWLVFDQTTFVMNSKQFQKVKIRLNIPKDASPGGHYAQISVRALSLQTSGGKSATISVPEVVVKVLITVKGEVNEDVRISDHDFMKYHSEPKNNMSGQILVSNFGNTHQLVSPKLTIRKAKNLIDEVYLAPAIVLPGTKRAFDYSLESPGYMAFYTAEAEVKYGSGGQSDDRKEWFFVSPSLFKAFGLSIIFYFCSYLFVKRENVAGAYKVLLGK